MLKKISYVSPLTDRDKIKIEFVKDRKKVLKFVVQYYGLIEGRWRTVMRIDNCYGFPHQHVYHLRKKQYKVALDKDVNRSFTEAKTYIIKEFQKIRDNFLFSR